MRRIVGIMSILAVAVPGWIVIATPAHAADQTINCGSGVSYPSYAASGTSYTLQVGSSCTHLEWTQTSGTTTVVVGSTNVSSGTSVSVSTGDVVTITNSGGVSAANVGIGDGTVPFSNGAYVDVSFAGGGGGGGGGSSSSSPANSAPVVETLNVEVSGSNTTCTGGNPSGAYGTWLSLPSADQCSQTGPTANSSAKLLGWATDPNFSVEIAQRQIDKGWGAYETFNEEGQLTGVFIPAGGATFVSGSNNLYPIWSK